MRRFIALLVLLLAAAAESSGPPTVLVFGDSLSAGYGIDVDQSWASLLQSRLHEQGYEHRVVNASISGETTEGGATRIQSAIETFEPALIILELGGNDGLRGLPLEVTRDNLAEMIGRSRAAGAEVIISEIHIPPNYGRVYTERFNAIFHELAAEQGVTLLPFLLEDVALEPGMMQNDGVHPTAAAQPVILDAVWEVMAPMLP